MTCLLCLHPCDKGAVIESMHVKCAKNYRGFLEYKELHANQDSIELWRRTGGGLSRKEKKAKQRQDSILGYINKNNEHQ